MDTQKRIAEIRTKFFASLYENANLLPTPFPFDIEKDKLLAILGWEIKIGSVLKVMTPSGVITGHANVDTRLAVIRKERVVPLEPTVQGNPRSIMVDHESSRCVVGEGLIFPDEISGEKSSFLLEDLQFFKQDGTLYILYEDLEKESNPRTWVRFWQRPGFE